MEKLTLLIPANKESESLPIFLKELDNYDYNIIVILQSEDIETLESIAGFKNIKIHFQKNRGYGNALIEGIEVIDSEYFCIINADGSMDPKYLKEMLMLCESQDFIFASRYLKGGGSDDDDIITFIGNKCFSFIGNLLFKLNLSDILYTYIIGKTKSVKKLGLSYGDFRICVEIPIKAKFNKMDFISLPSYERKRIGGKKKVNALKDGLLILIEIVKYIFDKKTKYN